MTLKDKIYEADNFVYTVVYSTLFKSTFAVVSQSLWLNINEAIYHTVDLGWFRISEHLRKKAP
jgi:hypothetical protein